MWYIHTVLYYLTIKKILMHVEVWIDLEKLFYMKEASHKTPHIVWFHLFEMPKIGKSIETIRRLVVASKQGRSGWWKWRAILENGVSFRVIKMFYNWWWFCLHNTVSILKTIKLYAQWVSCMICELCLNKDISLKMWSGVMDFILNSFAQT